MAQGIEHAQFDLYGTGQGEGEAGAVGHGVKAEAGGEVGLVAGGGNHARRVGHGEVAMPLPVVPISVVAPVARFTVYTEALMLGVAAALALPVK